MQDFIVISVLIVIVFTLVLKLHKNIQKTGNYLALKRLVFVLLFIVLVILLGGLALIILLSLPGASM